VVHRLFCYKYSRAIIRFVRSAVLSTKLTFSHCVSSCETTSPLLHHLFFSFLARLLPDATELKVSCDHSIPGSRILRPNFWIRSYRLRSFRHNKIILLRVFGSTGNLQHYLPLDLCYSTRFKMIGSPTIGYVYIFITQSLQSHIHFSSLYNLLPIF
jgi:hypothetical protein